MTADHRSGAPRPVHISSIAAELGTRTPLEDLRSARIAQQLTVLRAEGLAHCRVAGPTAPELAAACATRTLAAAGVRPDSVVYSSESFAGESVTTDLWDFLLSVGTPATPALAVNGNGCGNLANALEVARNRLRTEPDESSALVTVADRLDHHDRYQPNGQTVLSDGAASCLVTTAPQGPSYRVLGISCHLRADWPQDVPAMASARTVMAGVEAAVTRLRSRLPDPATEFGRLITGNYGSSTRSFLAMAAGLDPDDAYAPLAADTGHCFAADPLLALDALEREGAVLPGERLLVLATSSRSWSAVALEYCA
ncbi:hypothetical protein GCM10009759_46250 [Kitasatospora saccharophila]|uniref:3-oxoacyl-[acyl-carrier-protein] synthase-3 n=1 Tax=Kitasatospora saccharophila TaxID=407973 RepID=A0ABN2X8N6_9ACTN